jgi:hypothetical protein
MNQHQRPNQHNDNSDFRDLADLFGAAEALHCYSRADAIADGILIDVTDTTRGGAGFNVPDAAKGDYAGKARPGGCGTCCS